MHPMSPPRSRTSSSAATRADPPRVGPSRRLAYQDRPQTPLSDMSASSSVMSNNDILPAVAGSRVTVEFRAATIGEVRSIDLSAPHVVLPAHLFLNRGEWRHATSGFPVHHPNTQQRSPRPPGSLIWAQLASRSGSMLVGGRDRFGMPSIPMPTPHGDIAFVSAVPAEQTRPRQPTTPPAISVEHVIVEPEECQPIISADGEIACAFASCNGCLTVLTRNSWSTSIACVCD